MRSRHLVQFTRLSIIITIIVSSVLNNTPVTGTPQVPVPKTMTVCMASEPGSLYTFGENTLVKAHVLEAIYDFGIENRSYAYQAVGLARLPGFENGGAGKYEVIVQVGDKVHDAATDQVVDITPTSVVTLRQLDGSLLPVDFAVTSQAPTVQITVTWTLTDNLTWEDGNLVTTDDILFAWDVLGSPDTPVSKYYYERTASYIPLDNRSWTWTGLPGFTTATYFMDALVTPLPVHRFGPSGTRPLSPGELFADDEVNRDPLAFGPFKLIEWIPGIRITLEKNPTYYRVDEDLPRLNRLVFRFVSYPDDLVTMLLNGDCDLGTSDNIFQDVLPLVRSFESVGQLSPQLVSGTIYEHLDFNTLPVNSYSGFAGTVVNDGGSPIFSNLDIRKAINYCLDKQAVIDSVANGAAVKQDVYVSPDHPLYAGNENLNLIPFDPAAGLQLLADIGWTDTDSDGVLDKDGVRFSFVHSTRVNAMREMATVEVQAQLLENCKMETTILLVGGEYFADGPDGMVFGRKYDLGEFAWLTGIEPPCGLYMTENIPGEGNWGGQNNTGWSDPGFDAACDAATTAIDPVVKSAQHILAQQIFMDNVPSIILFARAKIIVTRPEVSGVFLDPTNSSELWNVEFFDVPDYGNLVYLPLGLHP